MFGTLCPADVSVNCQIQCQLALIPCKWIHMDKSLTLDCVAACLVRKE